MSRRKDDLATATMVAGAVLHFVAEKHLDEFTSWLNDGQELAEVDPQQVRRTISKAHDVLAPRCNTPIEAL